MAEAQYAPNHTIDPETGFIESNGYISAFDAPRKKQFLEVFKQSGLGLYRTCNKLGLSYHTVNKHYQADPVFKEAYDQALQEYTDELEATSRENALNPRSVIERIFQLKCLKPEKYADQRQSGGSVTVNISVAPETLKIIAERSKVIDVEPVLEGELEGGK